MTVLYVLLGALALLATGAWVRIGGGVEYGASGLHLWLKVGALHIPLYPRERKKQAPPKEREKGQPHPQKDGEKKKLLPGGPLAAARELLPPALQAAARLGCSLQVDELDLVLTIGMADPADAALYYGQANAVLASLWQPMVEGLHIRDGRARIAVDFDADHPTVAIRAVVSIRAGRAVAVGAAFAVKALRRLLALRAQERKEKAAQSG